MSQQVKVYRELEFYYGGHRTMYFDSDVSSTILYLLPNTDATESLNIGNGTKNMDVKIFGNSSSYYLLWDESANTLDMVSAVTGTSADNAMAITVTDSTTASSGYCRGFYVSVTSDGVKTSTAEINAAAFDVSIQANVAGSVYNTSLYIEQSGDPTVGNDIAGLYMYLADKGAGATYSGRYSCLDLNLDSTNKSTGGNCFMRIYGHGGAADNVMAILGNGATNLVDFDHDACSPISTQSTALSGVTTSHKIACLVGSTTVYIPVVTTFS